MRSLKEALRDNQQRFRKMPKGPVGSYIRLKDYKWSTAVEQVLKGVLFCFVVDNAHDDAEFKKLANKVFRRGSHSGNTPRVDTIISSFQVGSVSVVSGCGVAWQPYRVDTSMNFNCSFCYHFRTRCMMSVVM